MSVCMDLFFLSVSGFFSLKFFGFLGDFPQIPTGALPWILLGDFCSPNSLPVPLPNQNPGSAPGLAQSINFTIQTSVTDTICSPSISAQVTLMFDLKIALDYLSSPLSLNVVWSFHFRVNGGHRRQTDAWGIMHPSG